MPEIFRTEINKGFISIWQVNETVDFFSSSVEIGTLQLLQNKFEQEKRLKEKTAPHFILKKFDSSLVLNNLERKPELNKGNVSISHCKDFVAVAFNSTTPIGIDIEYFGDRILKIIHKFLGAEENNYCQQNSTKCLMIWAAKEAIFKKYGGDTAFFKENILISPFELTKKQLLSAKIQLNNKLVDEKLVCELFDEFVMVYTV